MLGNLTCPVYGTQQIDSLGARPSGSPRSFQLARSDERNHRLGIAVQNIYSLVDISIVSRARETEIRKSEVANFPSTPRMNIQKENTERKQKNQGTEEVDKQRCNGRLFSSSCTVAKSYEKLAGLFHITASRVPRGGAAFRSSFDRRSIVDAFPRVLLLSIDRTGCPGDRDTAGKRVVETSTEKLR